MFKSIADRLPRDKDFPARQHDLNVLTRVLDGTLYDHLVYPFHEEKNDAGEYIKLRDRRPSVRSRISRIVVDDSVSLLFSEGHFPSVDCKDEKVRQALTDVIKETKLNETMIAAATTGSVGSVALLMRILANRRQEYRIYFDVMATEFLTPIWRADEPDTLESVREQYKVKGADLAAQGYAVPDDALASDFWFARVWDDNAETWYEPWPVIRDNDKPVPPIVDQKRTVQHRLGFVPVVWAKNLPGGNGIDGASTFRSAVETEIEIDYLVSQGGRGLKYASDPTLLLKEPASDTNSMVRGAANALVVSEKGDAKLLEINGTASEALIAWTRMLREMALESVHGNRANPDKLSAAQSGRAMELLNQSLVWLADKLRISYGEGALLSLLKMVVRASETLELTIAGEKYKGLDQTAPIALRWQPWFPPTAADKAQTASTLKTHDDAGHMSRETAVKTIAPVYDIEDTDAELARIKAEEAERLSQVPKTQVTETIGA